MTFSRDKIVSYWAKWTPRTNKFSSAMGRNRRGGDPSAEETNTLFRCIAEPDALLDVHFTLGVAGVV